MIANLLLFYVLLCAAWFCWNVYVYYTGKRTVIEHLELCLLGRDKQIKKMSEQIDLRIIERDETFFHLKNEKQITENLKKEIDFANEQMRLSANSFDKLYKEIQALRLENNDLKQKPIEKIEIQRPVITGFIRKEKEQMKKGAKKPVKKTASTKKK